MIFSDNSQYGWGASNIAMPRAAFELHPGRRHGTGAIALQGRSGGIAWQWRSSHISRTFLADLPWRQLLFLGFLSSIIIAYLHFLDLMRPRYQHEQRAKPVEVIVALQKDESRPEVIPDEQNPVITPLPAPVKKEIILEPVSEAPQKPIIEKPKEIKPEVLKKMPPEPKISPVKIKPRVVPKKTQEPQRIAAIAPHIDKPLIPEKISIPQPTVRKRIYAKKNSDKILQLHQAKKATQLMPPTNPKLSEDIDDAQLRHVPLEKPLLAQTQFAPSDTNPPVSFQVRKSSNIGNLKLKKSDRLVNNLPPPEPIRTAVDVSFASSRPRDEFVGAASSRNYQFDKQYTFAETDRSQVQVAQSKNRKLSFQSQNLKESPELTPQRSKKLIGEANQSVTSNLNVVPTGQNFSATTPAGEFDPSELISLQSFNVCKDPEREFRQKTQLAACLINSTQIEVEHVVFFIKYTESGYTIDIHIYNPYGRQFKNRCEVLELALSRIANRTN